MGTWKIRAVRAAPCSFQYSPFPSDGTPPGGEAPHCHANCVTSI